MDTVAKLVVAVETDIGGNLKIKIKTRKFYQIMKLTLMVKYHCMLKKKTLLALMRMMVQ